MKQLFNPCLQAIFATSLAMLLVGCGFQASAPSKAVTSVSIGKLQGTIHGGINPIMNATVTLYETQVGATSTYGGAGLVLDTTTTNSNGSFTFNNTGTSAYTCSTEPYMQYAYLVVTGGNTGANATNNNSVLMAALGPCSSLASQEEQSATSVVISEATTVAAAYALGNFMTVAGTAGSQVVQIGSTAANDASSPACTGSGSTMSCAADGLGHAFANAAELASAVTFGGNGFPTGIFNTTVASFPGSVIPQAMLNVVANALQACVNSSGASSSNKGCSTLFTDATPVGGSAPTDTLSAAINIAKYPAASAIQGSTGIFSLATATSFYQPTIAAAPTDYSLAIVFPGGANYPFAYSLALDIADNVYILAADGGKSSTQGGVTGVTALTTTGLAAIGYNASNQTSLLYGFATNSSTSYLFPGNVAVDGNQNVYASNVGKTSANSLFREFAGTTGTLTTTFSPTVGGAAVLYVDQMAVDRSNNLWTVNLAQSSVTPAIYEVPTTGTITNYSASGSTGFRGIAIDSNQNVWSCPAGKSAAIPSEFAVFPGTGGTAGSILYTGSISGVNYVPFGGNVAIDANNAGYCATSAQLAQATISVTSNAVSANPTVNVTAPTIVPSNDYGSEVDGNGNYFGVQYTAAGGLLVADLSGTGSGFGATDYVLTPCYPTTTNNIVYCSNNSNASPSFGVTAFPTAMQIDSTGSLWVASGAYPPYASGYSASSSFVVQVIGAAAPTWPQLSYGYPGVRPGVISTQPQTNAYEAAGVNFLNQLNNAFYNPNNGLDLYSETINGSTGAQSTTAYLFSIDNILQALYWGSMVDPTQYESQLSSLISATSWYKTHTQYGTGYGTLAGETAYFDDNSLLGTNLMDIYLNVLPNQSVLNESLTALTYVYSNTDAQGGIPQVPANLGQGDFYMNVVLDLSNAYTNYYIQSQTTSYLTIAENYFTEVNNPALGLMTNAGLFIGGTNYDSATGVWTPNNIGPLAGNSTHVIRVALSLYKATGQTSYLTYAENLMPLILNKYYIPGGGVSEVSVYGGYGVVDALCQMYMADGNMTWFNDAQNIVNFLLNDSRDTAGWFPDGTTPSTGDWDIVRTGDPPDASVTVITQAAAAAAVLEFAYIDMHMKN